MVAIEVKWSHEKRDQMAMQGHTSGADPAYSHESSSFCIFRNSGFKILKLRVLTDKNFERRGKMSLVMSARSIFI